MTKTKQKKTVKTLFERGKPVDRRSVGEGLKFTTGLLVMILLYLLMGTLLLWDNNVLRIVVNLLVVAATCFSFLSIGMSAGARDVNTGEILYRRLQSGKEASLEERALPYHSLKGFLNALIGTIPLLIAALLLAVLAQKQATGIGNLPSWVSAYHQRPEVGAALQYYTAAPGMDLEGVLRIIVRLALMPFASMVGSTNYGGMLLLERLSPLLVLLPGLGYGVGYLRGVRVRDQVHTDIAANRRKRIRREKKQQAARRENRQQALN